MNGTTLYNAITGVDPALIDDAAPAAPLTVAPAAAPLAIRRPRTKQRVLRWATAAAACLVLMGAGSYQMLFKTVSTIYVTINPHVSLELNRVGGVTGVEALNADGFTLLQGYDYAGKDRLTVAEELIQRARDLGFLTDDGQVTFSIESDSTAATAKYEAELLSAAGAEQAAVSVRSILPLSEVKAIALEHFGLSSATVVSIECDAEHDRAVYEIELHSGGVEYECEIDALTGAVLASGQEGQLTANPSVTALTEAQARSIALTQAGLSDAVFIQIKLDSDDGRQVYELKFRTETCKYECDIDAATGAVLDFSLEYLGNSGTAGTTAAPSGGAASAVTLEQAKAAALKRAGLSSATFEKAELDSDDGRTVYELEFCTDTHEYECTVDAATGAILDYEDDLRDDAASAGTSAASGETAASITMDQAKAIALERAGLSSAAFPYSVLVTEDGLARYKLKFYTTTGDYFCQVDAATGAILEYEGNSRQSGHEHEDNFSTAGSAVSSSAAASITLDQAKAAALARAGLSSATFEKAELDHDDGLPVYELEFYTAAYEYECEVDGVTGAVLDYKAEAHDHD